MSVVKMKKLSLVFLKSSSERLLNDLLWLSCVDVTDLSGSALASVETEVDGELSDLREKLSIIKNGLDVLYPYSNGKKSLFAPRRVITKSQLTEISAKIDDAVKTASAAVGYKNKIVNLKSAVNKNEIRRNYYLPWVDYPLPLGKPVSDSAVFSIGTVPVTKSGEIPDVSPDDFFDACQIERVGETSGGRLAVCAVYSPSDTEAAEKYLNALKFVPAPFKEGFGTALEEIASCDSLIAEENKESDGCVLSLKDLSDRIPDLENAYDALTQQISLAEVRSRIISTGSCSMIEGYYPAQSEKRLEKVLSKYDCWYDLSEVAEGDDAPVMLSNRSLVTPFESITKMYALPIYGGLDPTPAMAPFFFILFGMMLSDAGYGFVMALCCALGLIFLPAKPGMKNTMKLFMFCGLSTVFWGLMFGTVFGNSITVIAQTYLGLDYEFKPLWFDPVNEPMSMLILSIVIGYIQIIVSLVLKMAVEFRNKNWMGAVFDAGSWILILLGLGVIALNLAFPAVPSIIGVVLAILGAAIIVCTAGREKKGLFGKITGGLLGLYDSTGYLSDLLSYSRILALGLSSGVIGQVFNTMGSLMGKGVGSFIFFVIIFLIGHTLNFALSFLSAYVHASRLQFIEFFGRFYESGGRPYEPLAVNGKYSDIVETISVDD